MVVNRRNSFYAWASDFYGHNDMDMVSRDKLASAHLEEDSCGGGCRLFDEIA